MSFTEESKELLKEVKENTVGSKENVMNSAENQIEKLDKETKEKESSESRQRKLKEHWDYKLDSNKRQLAGLESSEDASVVFRKQASNLRKQIVPANLRGPVKDLIPRNSLSSGYADILNRVESPKLDFSISGFLSKSPRTPKRKVHAGFRGDISAENPFHISPIRTPVGVTPVHTPPRYLENAQNFAKMLTMDLTPGRHRSDPLSKRLLLDSGEYYGRAAAGMLFSTSYRMSHINYFQVRLLVCRYSPSSLLQCLGLETQSIQEAKVRLCMRTEVVRDLFYLLFTSIRKI